MAAAEPVTETELDSWADDTAGPVALHLRQKLVPVEGEDAVVFPPTYPKSQREGERTNYDIDVLSDGTKVVQLDSVGSQANRMEPLFKEGDGPAELTRLVPQVRISVPGLPEPVSLMEAGHRLGDALVRSTELAQDVKEAFFDWHKRGDAHKLAKLAPTSIVFGAWDSRDSQAKLPRLVQSVVRGWDVERLRRSAQYIPPVQYDEVGVLSKDDSTKNAIAERGYVEVPSVDTEGGVVVRGGIYRDVTVNLVALRQLAGGEDGGQALRRYVLGLTLATAAAPQDGYLRQGCLLVPDGGAAADWQLVARTGERRAVALPADTVQGYAHRRAEAFGVGPNRDVTFDKKAAAEDIKRAKGSK